MHQNALIAIAATLGIATGAGGTYLATSEPKVEAQAISKAELVAAISADPSLCPVPEPKAQTTQSAEPELAIPTVDDATAAFRRAKPSFPAATLTLGQCDKNSMGPGVSCAVQITWKPGREAQPGVVGFAKSPAGWQAMHYY
ncbi:hypothetical protein [Sinorhizobium fredii]|uniref:hypothetical protein n=1 Tax=Rhizobium fredii TaxID=380 RepID=UPI0005674C21|nr:hypothetical protein [Sinorhizobium fredii]